MPHLTTDSVGISLNPKRPQFTLNLPRKHPFIKCSASGPIYLSDGHPGNLQIPLIGSAGDAGRAEWLAVRSGPVRVSEVQGSPSLMRLPRRWAECRGFASTLVFTVRRSHGRRGGMSRSGPTGENCFEAHGSAVRSRSQLNMRNLARGEKQFQMRIDRAGAGDTGGQQRDQSLRRLAAHMRIRTEYMDPRIFLARSVKVTSCIPIRLKIVLRFSLWQAISCEGECDAADGDG